MIAKANMVTYTGPTMIANSLHACAILLKRRKKWDWFINLSAADYPLVTQDDIIHVFSSVPRNLNFVDHTSRLGWKEAKRAKPMIVDPGLYMSRKSSVFWVSQKRDLPTAFKLFTGSAWMALSREFVDFCVVGWDNLPRMLLMYYTNFVSSPEGYFHTVICNAPEFAKTVVNNDLHYIAWDTPPKQHPRNLTAGDIPLMVAGGAAFARKFGRVDANLDWIDSELLGRTNGSFVPGGWCAGSPPCSEVGNVTQLNPGPGPAGWTPSWEDRPFPMVLSAPVQVRTEPAPINSLKSPLPLLSFLSLSLSLSHQENSNPRRSFLGAEIPNHPLRFI
ncbi:unnamed protein product [Spirodela intermedia]|uniref:Uncharacterized protein n=1 Tax=Spirodela intermedia TaxID=51605 RepID=A0A7I8JN05_SPIIN|nr:unnamed protein product [Spirodela intermedia]CAA6671509.1 unnamed protein product [Spirodela intermedia]